MERSLVEIGEHPEGFQVIVAGVRRKTLRRFPYSLLYAIEPDRIRVLAVAHQKRRPYYWLKRLVAP